MQLLNTFVDRAATDIDGTAGSISHGGAIYISSGHRHTNEILPMFDLTPPGGGGLAWGQLSPLGYFMAPGAIVGINKCNRRHPNNSRTYVRFQRTVHLRTCWLGDRGCI